jgi:hypothetical protein
MVTVRLPTSRWVMLGVEELVNVVFSGLSPLIVDMADEGERIQVWARTPDRPIACSECGAQTVRGHGYHDRTIADIPVQLIPHTRQGARSRMLKVDLTSDQTGSSSAGEGIARGRRTMSEPSRVATMAKGNRSSSRQSATSSGWTP